ncbi:hypothetical protein [Rugamonas rubra]|uniref:Uncharacterized protein n=1 Tax=Rugamonas rubra TaxID=758825 RepID=A0A1I4IIY1_9BURK|nr:hypothetical protein [Rugamonas rubra]SFL54225.1 hypothetical protein SAMN02982985_00594 [Rugamonas rubra]
MQLHLLSLRCTAQRPDWAAPAVAGFGAGGVLMLLELFWSSVVLGGNPWPATRMVAAIAMGEAVLRESGFSLVIALLLLTVGAVALHLLSPWWLTPLASNWRRLTRRCG